MYKSLYTLIKAHRYASATEAQERVMKAYPKYLSVSQFNELMQLIDNEYSK